MPDGSLPRPARTLRTAADLARAGLLPAAAVPAAAAVAARYSIAVTPAMAALIDPTDAADPIARQYIPDAAELVTAPHELADPTADGPFTPVKGVVHRYPDRAPAEAAAGLPGLLPLLLPAGGCGAGWWLLSEAELEADARVPNAAWGLPRRRTCSRSSAYSRRSLLWFMRIPSRSSSSFNRRQPNRRRSAAISFSR